MVPRSPFRLDVNALRALAVALVVAFHATGRPGAGWLGVDVFFVISGYLITGLLVREQEQGTIHVGRFLVRRFWRLAPAALTTLGVVVLAASVALRPPLADRIVADASSAMAGWANWRFLAVGSDYWARDAISPVEHFWSLAVETQFYVIWPLLLLSVGFLARLGGRRGRPESERRRLRVVVAVLAVGSMAVSIAWAVAHPEDAYFDTAARVWELAFGALLAVVPVVHRLTSRRASVLVGTGFLLVVVAGVTGVRDDATPMPDAVLAVVGAGLVVWAGGSVEGRWPVVRWSAVQGIGNASYSIYLWHMPVLVAAQMLFPEDRLLGAVVGVAVAVLLGVLSRRWIELPALRWANRVPGGIGVLGGVTATALAAGTLVIASVLPTAVPPTRPAPTAGSATAAWTSTTLRESIDRAVRAQDWPAPITATLDDLPTGPPPGYGACDRTDVPDPRSCRFGQAGRVGVAVVGSSVGTALMPAAVEAFGAETGVRGLTMSGCPMIDLPVEGKSPEQRRACRAQRAAVLEELVRSRPQTIIVTHSYDGISQLEGAADLDEGKRIWTRAVTAFLDAVSPTGASIVFVPAVPEGRDPGVCAALRYSTPEACLSDLSAAYRAGAEAERAAAEGRATVLDTAAWYCSSAGACPAFVGDVLVRQDRQHITADFARRLAPVLRGALRDGSRSGS